MQGLEFAEVDLSNRIDLGVNCIQLGVDPATVDYFSRVGWHLFNQQSRFLETEACLGIDSLLLDATLDA